MFVSRVVLAVVGFVGAITVGMPVLVPAQYYPPPQDYDAQDYDAPQRDHVISVDVPPPPLLVYELFRLRRRRLVHD